MYLWSLVRTDCFIPCFQQARAKNLVTNANKWSVQFLPKHLWVGFEWRQTRQVKDEIKDDKSNNNNQMKEERTEKTAHKSYNNKHATIHN